jgi:orotate phosphoribosyltransferase
VAFAVASALDVTFAWSTPPDYALTGAVGGRVAIVDDAINAGSAVTSTAAALTGADLVVVGALLTLGAAPDTIAGAPVERLTTLDSALWSAPTCPRCAAGSPLDDPPP